MLGLNVRLQDVFLLFVVKTKSQQSYTCVCCDSTGCELGLGLGRRGVSPGFLGFAAGADGPGAHLALLQPGGILQPWLCNGHFSHSQL